MRIDCFKNKRERLQEYGVYICHRIEAAYSNAVSRWPCPEKSSHCFRSEMNFGYETKRTVRQLHSDGNSASIIDPWNEVRKASEEDPDIRP
ncbi:hypothetical protein TNIN_163071 [Trichonephila inaurata madagascariensis]|uniref:Uncharacterized protein n=1 Tax=Trichonephila inaurata madagascariensis TaxID=2747483 RepID=A0A8X6JVY6_9ARAC|nr:hypothetical protein TNIN_163071 [Trichonephila inaurata madagascariensis]